MLRIPHGRLIALRAPSSIDPKAEPPTELLMLKWGANVTTKGAVKVGAKSLASFAANQSKLGFDEVALDFEHNTVPGHPNNKGEPAAIAARGEPKLIDGEGLKFINLDWTQAGKEYREHYRDLSPAVQLDDSGEVIFCHSGALCRNGATFDLHAFNAGYDFKTLNVVPFDKPNTVPTTVNKTAIDLDRLRQLLELSADATVEDINRALAAIAEMPSDATGLNADAMAQIRALTAKINGFESRFADSERQAIVLEALNAGKIIPQEFLEGDNRLANPQLKILVAGLPEIVPLDARTPEKLRAFASLKPVNPVQKQVCDSLGISEESMKKYGGVVVAQ
jgi:hypothetical protein